MRTLPGAAASMLRCFNATFITLVSSPNEQRWKIRLWMRFKHKTCLNLSVTSPDLYKLGWGFCYSVQVKFPQVCVDADWWVWVCLESIMSRKSQDILQLSQMTLSRLPYLLTELWSMIHHETLLLSKYKAYHHYHRLLVFTALVMKQVNVNNPSKVHLSSESDRCFKPMSLIMCVISDTLLNESLILFY